MQVTNLTDALARPRRIAVGEFDGVHLGHRAVIAGNDTVLTFEPHPLAVVRPEAAPKLLTSFEMRTELIASLGVQELVVIRFDEGFAHQGPAGVHRRHPDRAPRRDARQRRRELPLRLSRDRETRSSSPPTRASRRASSRWSRSTARSSPPAASARSSQAGEIEAAARCIGAPFRLRGEVVTGDRRGRQLGFPTANIVPDEALVCPGHGVYAARVGDAIAAVSVGVRPTFGTGRAVLVEAFLIDRDEDLYGQVLTIEFIARLRGERRFASTQALIEQMHAMSSTSAGC